MSSHIWFYHVWIFSLIRWTEKNLDELKGIRQGQFMHVRSEFLDTVSSTGVKWLEWLTPDKTIGPMNKLSF